MKTVKSKSKLTSKDIVNNFKKQRYIIKKILGDCTYSLKLDKNDKDFLIEFSTSLGVYEMRRILLLCGEYDFNVSVIESNVVLIWHIKTFINLSK